jgi:hypothetical protein
MILLTNQLFYVVTAIVAQTSFWSAVLHIQNYDMNKFGQELQAIGAHMSSKK